MKHTQGPPSFEDFGFKDTIFKAIKDAGFVTPSPVQEKVIPYIHFWIVTQYHLEGAIFARSCYW